MNFLNLAEKFLAYDNIYDAKGSTYNEIYPETQKLLIELQGDSLFKSFFSSFIIFCFLKK